MKRFVRLVRGPSLGAIVRSLSRPALGNQYRAPLLHEFLEARTFVDDDEAVV